MTLSEAIRLGAMNRPQAYGGWMDRDGRCALASAADACGIGGVLSFDPESQLERVSVNYEALKLRWPILRKLVAMPVKSFDRPLSDAIWSLNDSFGWTREQIADWVETIEAQYSAPVVETEEKVTA